MTEPVRIPLPYGSRPYLHANQRLPNRAEQARIRQVRRDVYWLARYYRLGAGHPHVTFRLVWRPRVRRRRDGNENLAPLQKACIDGLVDAGVVPDDTPAQVTRLAPLLLEPDRDAAGLWMEVTVP